MNADQECTPYLHPLQCRRLIFASVLALLLCALLLTGCEQVKLPQSAPPPSTTAPSALPRTAASFSEAKRWLYEKVYFDHQKTFYCGCDYQRATGSAGEVNLASCGVRPRQDPQRAKRLEAEHLFPAAQFGNFRECWRDPQKVCGEKMSGRKCCEQADPLFQAAHNDLHNLVPAEGEINGDRKDYNWGMIPGSTGAHGACAMQIDPSIRRAEPPEGVKGDIARTMFYMAETNPLNMEVSCLS